MIKNGFIGQHIASKIPVEVEFNRMEQVLAFAPNDKDGSAWDKAMRLVEKRLGIGIIGEVMIDFLIVDGKKKLFH